MRSNQAGLRAVRGDIEGGLAIARRNCELTERLGDVFSRSLALTNLAWAQLPPAEYEDSLASIDEAERLYREAMDNGGEMESWRKQMRAQALTGVGRVEEAIEVAEEAVRIAGERGMLWSLPDRQPGPGAGAGGRLGATASARRSTTPNGSPSRPVPPSLLNDIRKERDSLGVGAS